MPPPAPDDPPGLFPAKDAFRRSCRCCRCFGDLGRCRRQREDRQRHIHFAVADVHHDPAAITFWISVSKSSISPEPASDAIAISSHLKSASLRSSRSASSAIAFSGSPVEGVPHPVLSRQVPASALRPLCPPGPLCPRFAPHSSALLLSSAEALGPLCPRFAPHPGGPSGQFGFRFRHVHV